MLNSHRLTACITAAVLCLTVFLVSCTAGGPGAGSSSQPADSTAASGSSSATEESAPYAFLTAGDTVIRIGGDMTGVLEKLGEPLSYFEAPSCAASGTDKTYTYAGFDVITVPDGSGKDIISSIVFLDDSAITQEGAYIGCTADEVLQTYGENIAAQTDTLLSAVRGGVQIDFIIENGIVISVEYTAADSGDTSDAG